MSLWTRERQTDRQTNRETDRLTERDRANRTNKSVLSVNWRTI